MWINANHFINLTKISQHNYEIESHTLQDFQPDWGAVECETPGCRNPKQPTLTTQKGGLSRYCEECEV